MQRFDLRIIQQIFAKRFPKKSATLHSLLIEVMAHLFYLYKEKSTESGME